MFNSVILSCSENNGFEADNIPPTHIVIYQGGINQSFDLTKNNFNEHLCCKKKIELSNSERSLSEKWGIIKYLWLAYNNWKPFTIGFLIGAYKDQIVKLAALSSIGFFLFCKRTYKKIKEDGIRSGIAFITKSFV